MFLDTGDGSPGHVVVQDKSTGVIIDPNAIDGQTEAPDLSTYLSQLN